MEIRLLNLYLKYIKENNKQIWKRLISLPKGIIFQLLASLFFLTVSIVATVLSRTSFNENVDLWQTICTIVFIVSAAISFVLCITTHISLNKYEINISTISIQDYWIFCNKTKKWIVQTVLPKCHDEKIILDEIREIKSRIDNYRCIIDEVAEKKEARIEKWIQTLAIPFVLAIITAVINKNDNVEMTITIIISIFIIGIVLFGLLWLNNNFKGLLRKQKSEQLKIFSEDLQGILDLQHYSTYIEINNEENQ